ncbi:MAG TPA: PD-(D/E)XK nuclease family protein [Clostridia bacterium]|nr:PD-(D/E)XK nuclease family protein [Clostridia bacterium]
MLHLILGRVGAGKTTHVHNLIKDYINIGDKGLTLIVPEQFSFATERAMLEKLGPQGADKVDVLSFTRLADSVFREYGGKSKKHISEGGKAILMNLALDGINDKLELYHNHSQKPAFTKEILKTIHELKQSAVSHEKIFDAVANTDNKTLKTKMNDIALIMSAYDAIKKQENIDDGDSLDDLYDTLSKKLYFKDKIVIIDSFRGFTQQELKIIERILIQSKVTYVTLCMDELYPLSSDAGIFTHVKKTAISLLNSAKKHNVRIAKPLNLSGVSKFCNFPPKFSRYENKALKALEAGFYDPSAKIFEQQTDDITLCAATEIATECSFVASTIKRFMRENNLRCSDIAIIARNATSYEIPLKSALKKCEIPVFEDKRQPIITQPLIKFIMSALDVATGRFSTETIFTYLKTGLTDISQEEVSELENYCILWQIDTKKWLKEWTMNPQGYGYEMTNKDFKTVANLNSLRSRVVEPLAEFKRKLSDINGLSGARAVYEFLDDIGASQRLKELAISLEDSGESALALEQERIWDLVMDILDEVAQIMGGIKVSPSRFFELFSLMVESQTLGNIPQGLDEITIGSAERIRISSPKIVFVVGVNEGVFPPDPTSVGLINDFERKEIRDLGLSVNETYEAKIYEERFIAYSAFCCSSQKLFVTYTLKSTSGEELVPSELVHMIKHQFPECVKIYTDLIDKLYFVEGVRPAFELACLQSRDADEVYETLKCFFKNREDYSDKMKALERIVDKNNFEIADKNIAKELFSKNLYISASKAEVYYNCPFNYFCKYGLFAKPRKAAEFDPMQKGTVTHLVLQSVLEKYTIEQIQDFNNEQRTTVIKEILDDYLEKKLGGSDKPGRFEYLYNRLVKILCEVLDRLIAEFTYSDFKPVDFELEIDNDGNIMPYEIDLGNGETLKIKGSIDRVDKMEIDDKSYIRIVDYKGTGKDFNLYEVLSGINMQMLIYLFALWQNGNDYYGNVVPSGVLYMPSNAPVAKIDNRNASEESIAKEKHKSSKMSGMVLNDAVVIQGMDKTGANLFLPVNIKKDGSHTGRIISYEQIGRLKNKVDSLLKDMVLSLNNGDIKALPFDTDINKASMPKGCNFCDFKNVCGWEEGMPTRLVNKADHLESLSELNESEVEKNEMDL